MSAIDAVFERCREEKRAAFIPYLTAGDPDLETSGRLIEALAAGGADLIELGVPFSDPIADGPVNQKAAVRALGAGTTLSGVLELVANHRSEIDVPIILFTYYNPVYSRGVEAFADQAAESGVDGILCVDLPPDEAEEDLIPACRERDIDTIFLLAPTSTKARIRQVAEASTGFVYYVSRTGVTGVRDSLTTNLTREAKRLRRRIELPLAVGFGISSPEQVNEVSRVADGVVVGSALVRLVEQRAHDAELAMVVEREARRLASAIHVGGRRWRG